MNTGSEKPCSQKPSAENHVHRTAVWKSHLPKTIFCIDPLKKPSTQDHMPKKPIDQKPGSGFLRLRFTGDGFWDMVFFGYGFCDTVFSAHDFGIRFFGYGFLGARIGFLWCKNPIFLLGSPCRPEKPSPKIPPPPKKKNVSGKPYASGRSRKNPSPKSEGFFGLRISGYGFCRMVFSGFGFLSMVFRTGISKLRFFVYRFLR